MLSRPSLRALTESEIVLNNSLASLIETFCSSIISTLSSIVFSTCSDLTVISLTICFISSVDCCDCSASFLISSATTANPLPLSPALAASIEALSDNRLVCSVISVIASDIKLIFSILPTISETTFFDTLELSIERCPFVIRSSTITSPLSLNFCVSTDIVLISVTYALVSFSLSARFSTSTVAVCVLSACPEAPIATLWIASDT